MKDFPKLSQRPDGDRMLSMMAGFLGTSLGGFSLTIAVSGVVLTGTAISRDEWVKSWLGGMRNVNPLGEALANGIDALIDFNGIQIIDDDLPDVDAPTYLHMKNVKVVAGELVDVTPLWRVRLKEISAWSPGEMSRSS